MLVCRNVQRIGNAEMIPEKFVQGRMFVNPDNFPDRYDRNSVFRSFDKIMLRDKHIIRGKLWQCGKFFFCFGKKLCRFAKTG